MFMCISLLIEIICHFPISVQLLLFETVAEQTWEYRHTHTHRCSCLSGLIDRANDATGRRGDCRQADEVGLTLVGCLSIVTVYSILYMYILYIVYLVQFFYVVLWFLVLAFRQGQLFFTSSNELTAVRCSSKLSSVELYQRTRIADGIRREQLLPYAAHTQILWESISEWRQAKLRWDWCQKHYWVDLWHGNKMT